MAIKLTQKITVPAKAVTPHGEVRVDDVEVNVIVIVHVRSVAVRQGKAKFTAIYSGDVSDVKSYEFACGNTKSHIKQAYEYLMTLNEFSEAVRINDEPEFSW
jgi:hypothetical protein